MVFRYIFNIIFFGLLIIAWLDRCIAETIVFERVGHTNQIKKLGNVTTIVQDTDGFMWFGSPDRLVRFDGVDFKAYGQDGSDAEKSCGRFVVSMLVDAAGQLWLGTDVGFCRYDRDKDKFEPFAIPGLPAIVRGGPLAEDRAGNLYLGVRDGVLILDKARRNVIQRQYPLGTDAASARTDTQAILVDSLDRVWVATATAGIALLDPVRGQYTFFKSDSKNPRALASNNIQSLAEGDNGQLWVAFYGQGLDLWNPQTHSSKHYVFDIKNPNIIVPKLFRDAQHNIWLSSDGAGLLRYLPGEDQFEHQYHDNEIDTSLITNKTSAIYEDRSHGLWVTSYPYGIHYASANSRKVLNYQKDSRAGLLHDNSILSFFERDDGKILVGTEKGINIYDPAANTISDFSEPQTALPRKPVTHINSDGLGNLWIATWGDGLYRVAADKKVTHYAKGDLPTDLTVNLIWHIQPNPDGSLWLATQGGGLAFFDPLTEKFRHYLPQSNTEKSLSSYHYNEILRDRSNRLWAGGYGGVDRINLASGDIAHLSGIPSTRIRSFLEDTKGRIWITTEDAGIFIWQDDNQPVINVDVGQGLPDSYVTGIAQDKQGRVWAATLAGLASIDPDTFAIRVYERNYGISARYIYRGALIASRSSDIYVGGLEGFSRFNPDNLAITSAPFPVYLTDLTINNQIIKTGSSELLSENIHTIKSLQLNYHHGSFAFSFAALNYQLAELNRYQYQLEGFDKGWNNVVRQPQVTYTNIPAGKYHFRVKAANSDGYWSPAEINLPIMITPPPWKSWWAYSIYTLLAFYIAYQLYRRQRDKIEIEKEKRLNLELLRVNRIKDEFLANTTHELRTPINGMIGLTLAIEEEMKPGNAIKEKFDLIVSSGRRLSHLIDDILDYAKMADKEIILHKSWVEVHALVERVFSIASPLAKNKTLMLLNETHPSDGKIFVDPNRIEQILLNLVSNAIKYTDSGLVKVFTCPEAEMFTLVVQDSGLGIAEADIAKLFTAFTQLDASASRRVGGTGLGLTVTKHLVEKHGGTIHVNSLLNLGSQFIIRLPKEQHSWPSQDAPGPASVNLHPDLAGLTILFADDDAVNCMILRNQLNIPQVQLLEGHNGRDAWNILLQQTKVDVVVLDLHMPHLGGFEVAKLMRAHAQWKNTPILFLSASIGDADRWAAQQFTPALIDLKPIRKESLLSSIALLSARSSLND